MIAGTVRTHQPLGVRTGIAWGAPNTEGLFVAMPDFYFVAPQLAHNAASPSLVGAYEHATQFQHWLPEGYGSSRWGPLYGGGSATDTTRYRIVPAASLVRPLDYIGLTNQASVSILLRAVATNSTFTPCDFRNTAHSNQHYPYSDGFIYMGPLNTSRWLNGVTSLVDVTLPHMLTFTSRNGEQVAYQNELPIGSASLAENPTISLGLEYFGGNNPIGVSFYIYGLWIWNKFRSPAQVRSHVANPWGVFSRQQRWMPLKAAAAAGGFKPYWAKNRNTVIVGGMPI